MPTLDKYVTTPADEAPAYVLRGAYGQPVAFVLNPCQHDLFFSCYDWAQENWHEPQFNTEHHRVWVYSARAYKHQNPKEMTWEGMQPAPTETSTPKRKETVPA